MTPQEKLARQLYETFRSASDQEHPGIWSRPYDELHGSRRSGWKAVAYSLEVSAQRPPPAGVLSSASRLLMVGMGDSINSVYDGAETGAFQQDCLAVAGWVVDLADTVGPTLSNDRLLELAKANPSPQKWFDEDMTGLTDEVPKGWTDRTEPAMNDLCEIMESWAKRHSIGTADEISRIEYFLARRREIEKSLEEMRKWGEDPETQLENG